MASLVNQLLRQLEQLDAAIDVQWKNLNVSYKDLDEDHWEHFVELLEYRVSLLCTLRDAGHTLLSSEVWPNWLEKLCHTKILGLRKRISFLVAVKKHRKNIKMYEDVGIGK